MELKIEQDWQCAKCGTNCWGHICQVIGKRKDDRKIYCIKCAKDLPSNGTGRKSRRLKPKEVVNPSSMGLGVRNEVL